MCIEKAKSIELQQPSGWQANSQAGNLVPGAWLQLPVGIYLLPVAKHLTSWLMSSRNRFATTVQNMKNVLVKRNRNPNEQKHERATRM